MNSNHRLVLGSTLLAGLAFGWAAGCGSTNLRARATFGPAGGSLAIPSEGVRLDVPAGALTSPVEVSLTASSNSRGVLVGIEPAQLGLARAATLGVTLSRPVHIASVTEVTTNGEWPLGVQSRVETASGSSTVVALDRFMQVRVSTEASSDGGTPGACRERDDDGDGDHHEGDMEGGGDGDHDGQPDGGSGDHRGKDGGVLDGGIPMECPTGFECDDGVCVVPGGDDEEEHRRCDGDGPDAGICPVGQRCDDGRCETVGERDGGPEDHPDAGHDGDHSPDAGTR